jgi:hypothetical protein
MGYKSYEFDRDHRITIYPSLRRSSGKGPGRFMLLIRKLLTLRSATGRGKP